MKKHVKRLIIAIVALALGGAFFFGVILANIREDAKKEGRNDMSADAAVTEAEDDSRNILVLGMDRQAGLCDVMMLVNVNFTSNKATVAQIPRDTYAEYTDGSYKKLNGAYNTLGGADKVAEFLGNAMGIEIDHYVCVGLDTLGAAVDAVGGVDVKLPCDMFYRDPAQGLYIDLDAGLQHLDGALAEQFVRFRSAYVEGDLGRIDAQKLFLAAFFEKVAEELSPALAVKLASAADSVETDLSISDMLSMGVRSIGFGAEGISLVTLPGEEAVATESGAWYYVLSKRANAEIMAEYFGADGDFDGEGVFLNPDYKSFGDIYRGYSAYELTDIGEVAEKGINIQIKK